MKKWLAIILEIIIVFIIVRALSLAEKDAMEYAKVQEY